MEQSAKKARYHVLDGLRGTALLNMIAYHTVWDLVYIFGFDWGWYRSGAAYVWQQAICWTFILLSGFCQPLGRPSLRRGLTVFGAGCVITAATVFFMPENRVVCGVLTLISSCMLLAHMLRGFLGRVNAGAGLAASAALFVLTRNVNRGFLGFEGWRFLALPDALYKNLATAFLGFPAPDFYSTDYFSLIPWCFLFAAGVFLNRLVAERDIMRFLQPSRCRPLEWLGTHSLLLYMLHQPVVYGILTLLF